MLFKLAFLKHGLFTLQVQLYSVQTLRLMTRLQKNVSVFQGGGSNDPPPCPCLWAPMLRNPIEKFRGVGISTDLHTNEREDIRKMIEEAKQVHIDNESEDVENYRFLVVGKGVAKK